MSDLKTAKIKKLHQALVDKLIKDEHITNTAVETAFRTIPRHLFLPDKAIDIVYQDDAIATKRDEHGRAISSSSQPAIMAIMLEQLDLQIGQNVLEIGAGTGYNAALMGHLVGESGHITTIDIDQDIVDAAQTHLAAAGCANVTAVCGDGMTGYAANAPYDRIILTVGGWEIAPAWIEQLQPDGRLLIPLSLNGPQFSIAFAWKNGRLTSQSVCDCGFMRIRGPHAGPDKLIPLDPDKTVFIGYEDNTAPPRHVNQQKTFAWLTGPYEDKATGIRATLREAWRSLMFWLAIHEPNLVTIHITGTQVENKATPYLFGFDGHQPWRMAIGILDDRGLATVVRPPAHTSKNEAGFDKLEPIDLHIRRFGERSTVGQQLLDHLQNWDKAGRPNSDRLEVTVYPPNAQPAEGVVLPRRWHTFVVRQ